MRIFHHGNFVAGGAQPRRFPPSPQQLRQPLLLIMCEMLFRNAKYQRCGDPFALRHREDPQPAHGSSPIAAQTTGSVNSCPVGRTLATVGAVGSASMYR